MTALNDSGPPRKRIATYGKAVRKRPPDHITFKPLQDLERASGAPRSASIISASIESVITDSSPSPSPSPSSIPTKFHIFDVPSGDEDDDAGTTPKKKRKLVHVARTLTAASVNDTRYSNNEVLQHASSKAAERKPGPKELTHDASKGYQYDLKELSQSPEKVQPALESFKLSDLQNSKKTSSMSTIRTPQKATRTTNGLSPRLPQQHLISSNNLQINPGSGTSSHSSKSQDDASTASHKLLPVTNGKRPTRPSTPKAVDCEVRDASMVLSSSSTLTPKGAQMWSDLLGKDDEDVEANKSERFLENMYHGEREHESSSRRRRLPRRRLIDTLVEQSKNHGSMSEIYHDLEDVTLLGSDSAPPSHVAENQEMASTQLATVKILPQKPNNSTRAVGLVQNSQTLGAKITYSRQRSMLAEQDLAKETNFDIPLHDDLPLAKLQNRRGSIPVLVPLHSLHENAEAEDGNVGVAIRTIHELRQAGAESRFKDEVEDLLDRIGKPALQNTTRRSGLMALAERMRDKLFYTKFISNGLDQRLFLHLGQEQDVISGFILVSLLIPMLEARITPIVLTQLRRQGITRLLIRLISVDESISIISKARKNNMSKLAQTTLMAQHDAFLQLRVWEDLRPQTISPRTASLRCLELMVRQSREAGDTGDIMSKELVSNLFKILRDSHDNNATTAEAIDFQLTLSTLVSHSLSPMPGIEEFLPMVRDVLEVTMQNPSEEPTVTLLLRLVLNTTNNSPAASDAFASPEILHLMCHAVIDKFRILSGFIIEDKRLVLVDHLVLILVVMINIAELSSRARQCFLAIHDSSLEDLVMIFQDNIERAFEADSVEDSHINVAGGYLAVLLGCLSLSPEVGELIRLRQRAASIQPLVACIDEFISHHKKVDALSKEDGEDNTQAGLTDRLQTLVNKLKAVSVS